MSAGEAHEITVASRGVALRGTLSVPDRSRGLVIFAHGSGSSRFSPRNRFVAHVLDEAGLATLLLDLLSAEEHVRDTVTVGYRFDIALLAERLDDAIAWAAAERSLHPLPVGLFGASTGAAAALIAAAGRPGRIKAVVSRGGRPDLAGQALQDVHAPTLLIVGGLDSEVIGLNERAAARMHCEYRLAVVPGATHLFEEPGALEKVADLAAGWFRRWLGPRVDPAGLRGPKLRLIS